MTCEPKLEPSILEKHLAQLLQRECSNKQIPGLYAVLLDQEGIVWQSSGGSADLAGVRPFTEDTLFRIGSITKLVTGFLVMQQVESGRIALDDPIGKHLPEFQPHSDFDNPITIRRLLQHKSGLVREAPGGCYFLSSNASLEEIVSSLNQTRLLWEPGTKTSYSNAGVCVLGLMLERLESKPYEQLVQERIFKPLGMQDSRLELNEDVRAALAEAQMCPYHQKTQPAPVNKPNSVPAGGIFSSPRDLARLASTLLRGGEPVLSASLLQSMWQLEREDDTIALGFFVRELFGHKAVGHGGTIYGYATELELLPSENLGVLVFVTQDIGNNIARRLSAHILELALKLRRGQSLPGFIQTQDADLQCYSRLVGTYRNGDSLAWIRVNNGKLSAEINGTIGELRRHKEHWAMDCAQVFVDDIQLNESGLIVGDQNYLRDEHVDSAGLPEETLIGNYGSEASCPMQIYARSGRLWARVANCFYQPLVEEETGIYRFPEDSLFFAAEAVRFETGDDGVVAALILGEIRLPRL